MLKRGTNSANTNSVGRLYSTFWSNLSKNLSFGVLCPYRCTDGGEIWHGV